MKYHSIFTPALTSLCLLTTTTSLASDSTTIPVEDPARWFEIEIILFKHISTKEQTNEQFTSHDLTAKKRNALDLLSPYIQPNIASLKQLLPACGDPNASFPYGIESTPFSLEAEVITEEGTENGSESSADPTIASSKEKSTNTAAMTVSEMSPTDVIEEIEHSALIDTTSSGEQVAQSPYVEIVLPNYNQYPSDRQAPLCVIPTDFFEQSLNAEQLAQFSIDGFPVEKIVTTIDGLEQWRADENDEITWASDKPYLISKDSLQLKPIANSIKRSRNYKPLLHLGWRQIGEGRRQAKSMKLYAGENLNVDYQQAVAQQAAQQTSLAIKAILEKRQQAEALIQSQQLLGNADTSVNANSLATNSDNNTDINIDGITDNSMAPETNLPPEASSSENLAAQLNATDGINTTAIPVEELSIEEELRQQAKQQQLDKLFQQFALLKESEDKLTSANISEGELLKSTDNDDKLANSGLKNSSGHYTFSDEEIKGIVAQLSADITKPVTTLIDEENTQTIPLVIDAPVQAWSLDGLFKVHLDRYLYLNSEFNIIKPLAAANTQKSGQAGKSQNEQQVISFKQDRRLITGEIHYFDHPYMGMVVQIRRFDPTKPADEAVTQAKK